MIEKDKSFSKDIERAFLLSPLINPVGFLFYLAIGVQSRIDILSYFVMLLFGCAVSYACMFSLGSVSIYILYKTHFLNYCSVIIMAIAIGTLGMRFFFGAQSFDGGIFFGVIQGVSFSWLAKLHWVKNKEFL
jgi:hypothetical protein